jgi:hypothetical protein
MWIFVVAGVCLLIIIVLAWRAPVWDHLNEKPPKECDRAKKRADDNCQH